MFEPTESLFIYLLFAANAALVAIACLALLRFERRWQRIENIWNSAAELARSDSASQDSLLKPQASQRLEQQLAELQRVVERMQTKVPRAAQVVERAAPIENAVRMARQGASIGDLTRNCGLNLGEARLLQKLHGRSAVATTEGRQI